MSGSLSHRNYEIISVSGGTLLQYSNVLCSSRKWWKVKAISRSGHYGKSNDLVRCVKVKAVRFAHGLDERNEKLGKSKLIQGNAVSL